MRNALLLSLLVACGGPKNPVAETPAGPAPTTLPATRPPAPGVQAEVPPAPPGTDGVHTLLRAHHTQDLPERANLDAHEGAEASLIWLARHADTMVVRVRALQLLGLYPGPDAEAVLVEVAGDPAAHASLRGGAVAGLAGQDRTRPQIVELLERASADPDPRVSGPAKAALTP